MKLSDDLILDARRTGKILERSIAGQIEFWAQLGRAIELLLQGSQVLALQKSGKARSLSDCLNSVSTPAGRRRVSGHLANLPFPHYEAHPRKRGLLVRIEADGRRTAGRFIGRRFQAVG